LAFVAYEGDGIDHPECLQPDAIIVSSDGQIVYTSSEGLDTPYCLYTRDADTGTLTWLESNYNTQYQSPGEFLIENPGDGLHVYGSDKNQIYIASMHRKFPDGRISGLPSGTTSLGNEYYFSTDLYPADTTGGRMAAALEQDGRSFIYVVTG
ncbi:unnamed protein product, partial [Chrysoparadoxa australica]